MQTGILAYSGKSGTGCFGGFEKNKNLMLKESLFGETDSFISVCLDAAVKPQPRFRMKGFFLHSSVDTKIKSVPIFIFSLQRYEARQTYISCFYAENYSSLFHGFNKKEEIRKDKVFFFNWFDHGSLVPRHPFHKDEISNVFHYDEGRFLDYRVFDSVEWDVNSHERLSYFDYFYRAGFITKRRFIRRSRFYKRKYDWFLKEYA